MAEIFHEFREFALGGNKLFAFFFQPREFSGAPYAVLQVLQASPVIGDLLRYTFSPLLGRLGWSSLMSKIVKEAAGKATGSEKLQAEGLAQRAKGKGEKLAGDAKQAVKDATNKVADAAKKL